MSAVERMRRYRERRRAAATPSSDTVTKPETITKNQSSDPVTKPKPTVTKPHAAADFDRIADLERQLVESLGATAKERLAALERQLRARLAAGFQDMLTARIKQHFDEYLLPHWKDRFERADLILKHGKPYTNAEYRNLLRAVHPDSTNSDNRHAAFLLLKEKEVLLRPEDRDARMTGAPLPTTYDELMAAAERVKAKAATKRAAKAAKAG